MLFLPAHLTVFYGKLMWLLESFVREPLPSPASAKLHVPSPNLHVPPPPPSGQAGSAQSQRNAQSTSRLEACLTAQGQARRAAHCQLIIAGTLLKRYLTLLVIIQSMRAHALTKCTHAPTPTACAAASIKAIALRLRVTHIPCMRWHTDPPVHRKLPPPDRRSFSPWA